MKLEGAVRVVSWNVHSWADVEGSYRFGDAVAVLSCLKPDIVCLQEALRWKTWPHDLIRQLASSLGMQSCFRSAMRGRAGQFGNALLAKCVRIDAAFTDLVNARERRQPRLAFEKRVLISSECRLLGNDVLVGCMHWGLDPVDRRTNAEQVLQLLRSTGAPAVVMGDLNAEPGASEVVRLLESEGMARAETACTFPSHAPSRTIDHILFRGFTPLHACAVQTDASDHLPVVADLCFT